MPVSRKTTEQQYSSESDKGKPYAFHGVQLSPHGAAAGHIVGDCPFCGREGKFSVDTTSGLWRCFVCAAGTTAGGGNALVFVQLLYERTANATNADTLASIAGDRRLLSPDTVSAWGTACLPGGTWLVPGYHPDGRMHQLYRRVRVQEKGIWVTRLLPTPGLWTEGKVHALHLPAGDYDPARPNVVICEGPWDGMALWEVWDHGNADTNIIAVPGCNAWRDEWTQMCRGKNVTIMFDSDHPRELAPGSGRMSRAGYDGVARIAKRLSGVAATVKYLQWGPDGYDPSKPSGYDVRDFLSGV